MAMGKKGGWTREGPRKKENIWAHEVPSRKLACPLKFIKEERS